MKQSVCPLIVATDNAMEERCFICGGRVGRGNQPSIGMHERMSKLVWNTPNSKNESHDKEYGF